MSSKQTLARPYARAAFESARAGGSLAEWQRKLAFAAAVAANPEVHALVGNPGASDAALRDLCLPVGEPEGSHFAAFIAILIDNHRLGLLPQIAELFDLLKREHEQVLKVTMRTAIAVDPPLMDALRSALKRRFNREIDLQAVLDPSVIGGAVIDAGEQVIDGSVRGRLERLTRVLAA